MLSGYSNELQAGPGSRPPGLLFLVGTSASTAMDRFQKELNNCLQLAQHAKHEDDRDFWENAAKRWKAIIKDEKPVIANARERRRLARFNRGRSTSPPVRTFFSTRERAGPSRD